MLEKSRFRSRTLLKLKSYFGGKLADPKSRGADNVVASPSVVPSGSGHIFTHQGRCPICETDVTFVAENLWFRDYLLCSQCLSIPRERAVFHVLNSLRPNWRSLAIHESSPSDRATSRKLRMEAPGYVATQFDPNIPLGSVHPTLGYRCENLAAQTFPDASFDVIVTQDVFEHLLDPAGSIRDIARTLRPGGVHVCSVPIVRKWESSRTRAMLNADGTIKHLLPAEYHGNPVDDAGSLVTTDWGYDIGAFFLEHSGMHTIIMQIDNINIGIRAEYIEILVSQKPPLGVTALASVGSIGVVD
jgi:SAM-dependent methyltransferase